MTVFAVSTGLNGGFLFCGGSSISGDQLVQPVLTKAQAALLVESATFGDKDEGHLVEAAFNAVALRSGWMSEVSIKTGMDLASRL